jgi:hypothetical protein
MADAITPPAPGGDPTYDIDWPRWQAVGDDTQVAIAQDGKLLPIHHGEARLQPRPFAIVVRMPVGKMLWLNAMRQPTFTDALRAGGRVYDVLPFAGAGMAEHPRNERRALYLASDRYSAWTYPNEQDHRFDADSVTGAGDRVSAERTVAFYHDVDVEGPGENKEKPIAELRGQTLFLVFFRTSDETPPKTGHFGGGYEEIGRAYLELKFE